MPEHPYPHIQALLSSADAEQIHQGLEQVRQEMRQADPQQARALFEMVAALFHFDLLDRPDLMPALEEAIDVAAGMGAWVIPHLLRELDDGDLKAQLTIGQALGRIGAEAIAPLMAEYQAATSDDRRVFILHALGEDSIAARHRSPAAGAGGRSMRPTWNCAIRPRGRQAGSWNKLPLCRKPKSANSSRILQRNLADSSPVIRAKAVRSLGKLAKFGHLNAEERQSLKTILERLMGIDEHYAWDYAFIVRREAEEAYPYVHPADERGRGG